MYRSITGLIEHLKTIDPNHPFTDYFLREACRRGDIRTLQRGQHKVFVSVESALKFLGMGEEQKGVVANDNS